MQPGSNAGGGYGETVTTTVDHPGGGGHDCLAWAAVAFSTAVADVDNDGLPDGVEDAVAPLKDPNDQELPNLYGMGASSHNHKDIFIEVNTTWAEPGDEWGSATAPYSATEITKQTRMVITTGRRPKD